MPPPALRQLSPSLYVLEDTCNVYLVKDGGHGLVIDFGSGTILELAGQAGVSAVEWVLHTHHHRDQAQGDGRAAALRIPVAAPEHERYLFESVESFWRNRRIFHGERPALPINLGAKLHWLHYVTGDLFTLTRDVPVAASLRDYETFRWRNHEFFVLPTPGHTRGSVTLVSTIDGKKVAFSGDLIHSPGKVQNLYDLQYTETGLEGIDYSVYSLERLKELRPELVCPSHGEPLADPLPGISKLIDKLTEWHRFSGGGELTARNQPVALSPHLVASSGTVCTFYTIISDSGKALFVDYGGASAPFLRVLRDDVDTHGRIRFLEHGIDILRARHGLKSIDVAMPTHPHDDHITGFPHLVRHYGARIWCHEKLVELLEDPRGRNVGCVMNAPLKVERAFRHRETFRWEEFEFTVVHSPGHTDFQMAMFATIDGRRVVFSGDAFFGSPKGEIRHNLIYRNDVFSDSHLKSVENLLEFAPELIAPGHGQPFAVTRLEVLRFRERLRRQQGHFRELIADEECDFGLDPSWVHLYPYQMEVEAGGKRTLEVRVRNHRGRAMEVGVRLVLPEGWGSEPAGARMEVKAKGEEKVKFEVKVPAGWAGTRASRVAIAADVVADGKRLGEIAEAVVDVLPRRA